MADVYRKPGKPPYAEQMVVLTDRVVSKYSWKWHSPDKQGRSTTQRWEHATIEKARARYDRELAAVIEAGWKPVPDWPGKTTKRAVVAEKPKKPKKPKPIKRVTRLTVVGRAARVTDKELAAVKYALPADWKKLVTTHGVRMFGNLVRITPPAKIHTETKRWVTFWTIDNQPGWPSFATLVPDPTKLVLVASSSNGDIVAHTGEGYVIFPRSGADAVGLPDLASVFGWFLAAIENAGGKPRPTYAPESTRLR